MRYHDKAEVDTRHAWGSRALLFGATTRKLSLMALSLLLAGCEHMVIIPVEEYKYFEPKQQSLRTIEVPKIFFSFTDDPAIVCEALVGKLRSNERYLGCAHWRLPEQTCTVFIPPDSKNIILGHEVRHCFEGRFH